MSRYGGQLYEWNTDMDIDDKAIPYQRETWGEPSAADRFLKVFTDQLSEKDKYTNKLLNAKKDGMNININSEGGNDLAAGMSRLAPDIHIQQGYRGSEYTIPGTPPSKGFGGTLLRGVGTLFGPVGAVAGNVAADATGADYW